MFHFLKYYTTTICRWFLRCRYSRGFGIQSPSAYSFVRYVINEHYPYYAYADLQKRVPVESRVALRLLRLCLRVANEVQPRYILDFIDGLSAERQEYFSAGARRARILSVAEGDEVPAVIDGERVVIRTGVQHVVATHRQRQRGHGRWYTPRRPLARDLATHRRQQPCRRLL